MVGQEAEELDLPVAEAGPLTISKVRPQRLCFFNGGLEPSPPKDSNEDPDDDCDLYPASGVGGVLSCSQG